MAATGQRRASTLAGAALAGLLAGPVLALAPAYADSTPVPTEPPGGATCAPGALTATCGQDNGSGGSSGSTGSTPGSSGSTPGSTGSKASGSSSSSSSRSSSSSSRSTSTTVATLPRTGPADALPYGVAGAVLLVIGGALVVATRRA